MKQKRIFMIMILVLGMILIPSKNYAVLQANANTHGTKKDSSTNWMINIRNMETQNQAMGLEETIDSTTMKATTASNGIDVHMIKTTEYGAIAILSASGYGNPEMIHSSEIKTTTGNKSGVYFNQGNEVTAGGLEGKIFSGIDEKYYNTYGVDRTTAKVGDALGDATTTNPGCMNWHRGYTSWISDRWMYFRRGSGSIFTADGVDTGYDLCRAIVVCGDGF